MAPVAVPIPGPPDIDSPLSRAIETDRTYFEMGATVEQLPGAVLAWMPGLSASPAGAVIHRVDPKAITEIGEAWVAQVERRLAEIGAGMARIYLDARDASAAELLRRAGYVEREELVFGHSLPAPLSGLTLRPVTSDEDWQHKQSFHQSVETTPDGHPNRAADWVALERCKCEAGMDAFLAIADGRTVGAIGAVWGVRMLRIKNIVVHPAHRRQSIGQAMLCQAGNLGRMRGISEQCVLAVRGEAGELFYRALGMEVIGAQVEWSKQIGGPTR